MIRVLSNATEYEVRLSQTPGAGDRCTCPWYAKHRGTRGPCAHVLAARIGPARIGPAQIGPARASPAATITEEAGP